MGDDATAIRSEKQARYGKPTRPGRPAPELPDLPAAAAGLDRTPAAPAQTRRSATATLFLLTLLSTVDGSLVALAATGNLSSLGGALTAGLTVIAGVGSWVAAQQAFAGSSRKTALRGLLALGVLTLAATLASVYVGARLATAVQLHILPKAAGIAILLLAGEVAGLRLPKLRGVPAPVAAVAGGVGLEVVLRWIPL